MNIPDIEPSKKVKFWIENDILFCKINQVDCCLSEDTANAYLSTIEEMANGKLMPFIVDIHNFIGNFSPDAIKIFTDSPFFKSQIISQAFVANTLQSKLQIGSYIRIFAQDAQVEIFDDMESALAYSIESRNKFNSNRN